MARNSGRQRRGRSGHDQLEADGGAASSPLLLGLQRTVGNRAVSRLVGDPIVQRLPYATAYTSSTVRSLLNLSEGRISPVSNVAGHPRQHVGGWAKAEAVAGEQKITKSVYRNTTVQDAAVKDALASGQGQLATLDAAPGAPTRAKLEGVPTGSAEVLVVKAKKRKGAARGTDPKSWQFVSGTAEKATVIVDSMGTNTQGDIHIHTAYPVI